MQCSGNTHLDSGETGTELKGGDPPPAVTAIVRDAGSSQGRRKKKGGGQRGLSEGGNIVILCTIFSPHRPFFTMSGHSALNDIVP